MKVGYNKDIKLEEVEFHSYSYDYKHTTKRKLFEENYLLKQENERLNKGLEYAKRIEKDYKTKFDKVIEYLGIDEEILETCEIYDVNGIEVYKILQGNKWNEVEIAYLDDKPIGSDKE